MPGAVRVREPQNAHPEAVDLPVEEVVPLARELVDPVDVDRRDRVRLAHGQLGRAAVHLPGPGEDDAEVRVLPPARLEHRELGCAVVLEILQRVAHRVEVTRLADEVEEQLGLPHEGREPVGVAHVEELDPDVLEALEVREIAAVRRHERVDEHGLGARAGEQPRQVRADEAGAAGDEHATPAQPVRELGRQRHASLVPRRRASARAGSTPFSTRTTGTPRERAASTSAR